MPLLLEQLKVVFLSLQETSIALIAVVKLQITTIGTMGSLSKLTLFAEVATSCAVLASQ